MFLPLLETSPFFFAGISMLLGLAIGSFLNVVIVRLPTMQFRVWRKDALSFLQEQSPEVLKSSAEAERNLTIPEPIYNLQFPFSECPRCHHTIRWYDNIPVLSFFWLKRRCRDCQSPISWRYPAVEALTCLLSGLVAFHFGFGWPAFAALLLTWILIAQTFIDWEHQILLDDLTLPTLWLGVLLSLCHTFTDPQSSILGAIAGYLIFWLLFWAFKLLTGKDAMGYGDFKFLAMLGAWLGWQALLTIILLASVLGSIVGITLIVSKQQTKDIPIPFGPYLAIAGWVALLWNTEIVRLWLHML